MSAAITLALAALLTGQTAGDAVLVEFSSQQCTHCQAMQPAVSQLASQGVSVQVVDVDKQLEVAQQFKVTGVPTFIALSGGRETGRIVGATTADKLAELVRRPAAAIPNAGATAAPAFAPAGSSPEILAKLATVRIKVEDATAYGVGTGTIIDTHDGEALVVTCGHLFRESKGKGKVTADVYTSGAPQTVDGQVIGYDLDRDIALISIRAGQGARAVSVAPPGTTVRPGDPAFTIGCDKGAHPSLRATRITAVNKYKGKPNFTAAGQPVDGRSGGGLFTADGQLIGICNAADPADDEGLYAGLASIHWQLDQIGQSEIYQRAAQAAAGLAAASLAPNALPAAAALPQLAAQMPAGPLGAMPTATRTPAPASPTPAAPIAAGLAADDNAPVAAGDDTEIVFIVRSKRDPAQRSEVYVVDQVAPDLIARITHAARSTGQQRAALARAGQPAARTASAPPAFAPGVVRGQSSD
jgi:S1-C subfamily serine protease